MNAEVSFLGRRTLEELAGMHKIDLERSLYFLQEKNANAKPQSRMKEVADTLETTPYELFEKLKTL